MYEQNSQKKTFMESVGGVFAAVGGFLFSSIEAIVIALAISVVLYLFFMTPHEVVGTSMVPTYQNGEHLIANKVIYKLTKPKRGDVIIFKYSDTQDFIKRVIAIPGDKLTLKDGRYFINGQAIDETKYLDPSIYTSGEEYLKEGEEITIEKDMYFVSGDNRPHSSDSRTFGPISLNAIKGRVWLVYYPFENFRFINNNVYK
ncbi:signal peptidase I [Candidatus Dojkabacteria bacterium]|nr:signal peptidase I [Candidatus Dojkabacteria bacterium]